VSSFIRLAIGATFTPLALLAHLRVSQLFLRDYKSFIAASFLTRRPPSSAITRSL
jgi:hypothetical protein